MFPVARTAAPPAVAGDALRALLAGPTAAERAAGYRTAVPAGVTLRGLTIRGGTATVDLTGRFAAGGGSASMFARLAQLTFTLTRFSTVDRVVLWLDGVPVRSFSGEGIVIDHPLVRGDYEDQTPAVLPDSPVAYARVGSPMRVCGTANTFEAVFHLDVRDSTGRTVTTARVQATSGTGTRGTFDVTVRFTGAKPGLGTVIAWYASPRDGARVEVATVPIRLG
ncbi:GerMN domain-containing protein [Actinokineospora guangxiensis]|uniref:GerMN domain-containing protein n=1 Tax=Actinokineospora guangxiensis TaxID=1490288 RepID=A0ABW0EXV5_9PSEU